MLKNNKIGQSAAKLRTGERSEIIPPKGSREVILSRNGRTSYKRRRYDPSPVEIWGFLLATSIWNLYKMMREIKRDDLVVFVMAHCEPYDVNGITHYRTMTNGKKLSKINLNAFLAYNLYTKVTKTPDNKFTYDLITQSDGTTEARSVMGVFDPKIENNLEVVRKSVLEAEIG